MLPPIVLGCGEDLDRLCNTLSTCMLTAAVQQD